jgi:hypothetical protein
MGWPYAGRAQGPAAPAVIPAPVSSLTATLSGATGHGLRANPDLFSAPEALRRPPHLQETALWAARSVWRVAIEWHFSVRFSRNLLSKNAPDLEPPYGIEP